VISKKKLEKLLTEGRKLNSQDYYEHCRKNHIKTFYFFCKKLCDQPKNTALSSTELNGYILSTLKRRGIAVNNNFNPQGWFGKAWTDWMDPAKNETHFKNEYYDVLLRKGQEPYFYQIRTECYGLLQNVLRQLKGTPNKLDLTHS
jgi:hypothetical protein